MNEDPPSVTVADTLRFAPPESETVYPNSTDHVASGTVPGQADSRSHFPICSDEAIDVSNDREEEVSENKSTNGDN